MKLFYSKSMSFTSKMVSFVQMILIFCLKTGSYGDCELDANPDNDIYLDMDYWIPKECEDGQDRYYYVFTADEIKALSEHEIHCAYVGLGTCDMEKANWDTEEGILEYCELYGDGYVVK